MKIQVYANSTLGGDRDLLETCADGDIPFVVQNTAPQVSFMGDLAVFDLPCVFDSLDAVSYTHLDVYKRQHPGTRGTRGYLPEYFLPEHAPQQRYER